jgi:uncharacterized protein YciI
MLRRVILLIALLCPLALAGEAPPTPKATPQWLYVLKLVPRLHDDKAWTKDDERVIGEHFRHLQRLVAERTVVLAGRTTEAGERTMGLVIFEAADEATARALMQADPAVKGGIMTATLHPYAVALQRAP